MRPTVRHGALASAVVCGLAVLALIVNALLGNREVAGETDGPVISLGEDWNALPTALVTGRITLVDGCLLVGDSVVFWPAQTTWDEERQAVEFGGDFEVSAAASLGEEFTGGGGFYSEDNVRRMGSLDVDAVFRCLRETGTDGAVFAYPGD